MTLSWARFGKLNTSTLHFTSGTMATTLGAKQTHTIDPKLQPWVEK